MIYKLKGTVEDINQDLAIIDVNGVGYGVFIPTRLVDHKIKIGENIILNTVTVVSQDDFRLFGFISPVDREFFRMLLNIPRIGPKGAMKIISSAPATSIMQAILSGDKNSLSRYPGVGDKVAERLIVELKEKVKKFLDKAEFKFDVIDVFEEVTEALLELGCSQKEACEVITKVRESCKGGNLSFEEILGQAFQILSQEELGLNVAE